MDSSRSGAPGVGPREVYAPSRLNRAARTVAGAVLRAYMRAWHSARLIGGENLPTEGPALILTNHASLLDVPLLMALDPFPNTALVAKASLFKLPVVRQMLQIWGAIPVDRQGRDLSGVRAILEALRAKQIVAIAVEGRRSRSGGRLEPVNPVLARLAASAGVPLVPVGILGTYRCLPPGALFPRRGHVEVRVGPAFRLERRMDEHAAAAEIQRRIAALLPADQQPLPTGNPPPTESGEGEP